MEIMNKPYLYDLVELPDDNWQQQGEALLLEPHVRHTLVRFGEFRIRYGSREGTLGLILVPGPPGVGKSDAIRWAADAVVRELHTTGNALVFKAENLMDEHLGRSQKNVSEFFDTIAFSARNKITALIIDDAESVFMSRQQSVESNDPTDVVKATIAFFQGMDRLRYNPNVLQYAALNIEGLVDPAILSRSDVVIPFELPNLEARTAILARKVKGLAGERVLKELAAATEGQSGRDLNKINLLAYLQGTAKTLEDLTEADYLRAVGLEPTLELPKEEPCEISVFNGSPAISLPITNLLLPPKSSTQQPNCSYFQNGLIWRED
jgi:SpoVK/Ycf46/Vps4 family AAA+-type ATPase